MFFKTASGWSESFALPYPNGSNGQHWWTVGALLSPNSRILTPQQIHATPEEPPVILISLP